LSAYDNWDTIPTFDPNNKIKHEFSGRRIQRFFH
jgi:putative transposase